MTLACSLTLLLAACGSSQSAPPLRTSGTLTVCSYAEFTPISYGDGEGYEASLVRGIARMWGVDAALKPTTTFGGIWLLPTDPATVYAIAIGVVPGTTGES